jgi:hypothetical protein
LKNIKWDAPVFWNLTPVSQSAFTLGEDIASRPANVQLPGGVKLETRLGLGGSSIQGRVQSYPGDIDFSERFEVKAPNSKVAAVGVANTIKEFLVRTRNNSELEFQELYIISTLKDGLERQKMTLSYDEIVNDPIKFDQLVTILQNLDEGNINTFWRAKADGNRFIKISKILDITAKKDTGEEVLFSTKPTVDPFIQEITGEDDFFLTRLSGAEYQAAFLVEPREIPSEKLSQYALDRRKDALKLTDSRNPKYLKAAKRAFNYLLAIGNANAMDAVQPIFATPEARVNQEVAVMEAIQSALDTRRLATRIIKVGEARTMLNNAAQTIEDSLAAANIAAQLRQLATDLPGNSSDLLRQNGSLSIRLAGVIDETETLINQGLEADVRLMINTYVRPYYQQPNT